LRGGKGGRFAESDMKESRSSEDLRTGGNGDRGKARTL